MLTRGFIENLDVDMDSAEAAQTVDSVQAAQTLTLPMDSAQAAQTLTHPAQSMDMEPAQAAQTITLPMDSAEAAQAVTHPMGSAEAAQTVTHPMDSAQASQTVSSFDSCHPCQPYKVQHEPCIILTVKVICGRNITNGCVQDYVDTPDPYVKLRLKTAPESRQRTSTISNNPNPVWNETFTFFLGRSENHVLEVTLMEENRLMDQETGTIFFNVNRIREFGKLQAETFNFNGASEIDMEFQKEWDQNPTLRYSLCLSDQEKEFMRKRKQKVWQALNALLGEQGPKTLDETPTIAVIGSGGGFRAMTGYSGVFKALADSGLLDCATYVCGLSGSSWYLSTLYSHERWPEMSPGEMQGELQGNIDKSWAQLLDLQSLARHCCSVVDKRRQGQPVSFTDLFGHMVGETLLKGRLESRLTDQRQKIEDARVPMPLYTCVHVKSDVEVRSFQEWVEFSPYEIGMTKYGTFMDSKYFGSKFFMGRLVKAYEEPPLHFLQGIWGSAYCVDFGRLLKDKHSQNLAETICRQMELCTSDLGSRPEQGHHDDDDNDSSDAIRENDLHHHRLHPPPRSFLAHLDSSPEGIDDVDFRPELPSASSSQHVRGTVGASSPRPICRTSSPGADRVSSSPDGPKKGVRFSRQVDQFEQCERKAQQRQSSSQPPACTHPLSQTLDLVSMRAWMAAVVHNFMWGLNLQQTYPLSPFTPLNQRVREGDEFDGIFDLHPTHIEHIYMVDAGLTFNSPYPLVLRPQRSVDVILSFDYSGRDSDETLQFQDLLLAKKWAKLNRLPFPPIDPSVVDREGLKEVYVFRDPHDPHCPIVLHFPLVNIHFRNFKAPGMPRETKEDKDFADFKIFDKSSAYTTCNFTYTAHNFQRLSRLTEFNTLHSLGTIREELARAVAQKKLQASPMTPFFTPEFVPEPASSSSSARRERNPFVFCSQSGSFLPCPTAQFPRKRPDQGKSRRRLTSSGDSSHEFMSTSSDSYDAVRQGPEQQPRNSSREEEGGGGGGEGEEFHDVPEAFTRDGEGVTDPRLAKMYYERARERRSRFRRQSTISSLNSLAESISLGSEAQTLPSTNSYNSRASSLSSGPLSIDIADLRQFQGIVDDHDDNNDDDNNDDDSCNKAKVSTSHSDNDTQSMDDNNDDDNNDDDSCNKAKVSTSHSDNDTQSMDDNDDDGCNKVNGSNSHSDNDNQSMDDDDDDDVVDENVEEHWFDGGSSGEHRGSVIRLKGREGS
ncbi:cytosolic phospholipase A2-like [Babylonia areolata]|uniref:cytosolic phospholipase A2-like n=1 Tax=Babylonia areolata TaxID=304850 RepID=UPI003FD5D6F6